MEIIIAIAVILIGVAIVIAVIKRVAELFGRGRKMQSKENIVAGTTGEENAETPAEKENTDGVRGLLVIVSMVVAILAYGALSTTRDFHDIAVNYSSFELGRFAWSVFIGIAYPIVGALVVKLCALLRQAAYLGKVEPWSKNTVIWLALVWPITFIFCLFVYPCLFFINLLF